MKNRINHFILKGCSSLKVSPSLLTPSQERGLSNTINKLFSQRIDAKKQNIAFLFLVVLVFHIFLSGCVGNSAPESPSTQEAEVTPQSKSGGAFFVNSVILAKNVLIFNSHRKDLLITKKDLKKGIGRLSFFSLGDELRRWPNMDDYLDLSGFCGGTMFANFVYDGKENVSFYFLAGEDKEGRFLIREYQRRDDGSIEFLGEQFFDIPKPMPTDDKE
jgi:hypothetical protein